MVQSTMTAAGNKESANLPGEPGQPVSSASQEPQLPQHPTWRSEDLLMGSNEAYIIHGEDVYRLRRTRSGKLVLFK